MSETKELDNQTVTPGSKPDQTQKTVTTLSDTRDITFYLKGFAITCVMVNHYINAYLSSQFKGYANGIVSLFFILSGYGIFYSLQKNFSRDMNRFLVILRYIYGRVVRILPLYWLSLLLESYVGTKLQLSTSMLIPLLQSPFRAYGLYWFIVAILQCYLIAPVLYLCIKRFGLIGYIILMFLLFLLSYVYGLLRMPHYTYFAYKHFFFGYIHLFALGMLMPTILSSSRRALVSRTLIIITFLLFFAMVFCMRSHSVLFDRSGSYLAPLFITSAFAFCLFMIATGPKPPLERILIAMGTYSYSLYLFHHSYYIMLSRFGIIKYASKQGVLFTILLFPIFFLICVMLEKSWRCVVTKYPSFWPKR